MKIVDNFNLFKEVMEFDNEDEFYFVQILIRGKDGHTEQGVNGNNKNRLVKYYTIRSVDELCKKEEEIKSICKALNARAYIHPTKRSFSEVADTTLRVTTDMYLSGKNIVGLKGAYSTACGKSFITKDKKFVVDIDDYDKNIVDILNYIEIWCDPKAEAKFVYKVPTAHGIHLITKPFNTQAFSEKYPDIDVHKNNPTLLYFECLEG
jgi:hypothetical protein